MSYGPWALIAGASEGLGAAYAHAAAERGLHVALVARSADKLRSLEAELRARHGVEVLVITLDLGQPESSTAALAALGDRAVGLLVYNAAYSPRGSFLGRPVDDALRAVAVNASGPVAFAHAFGGRMAERGRGAIVLLSSLTAFQGSPYLAAYGATKSFNLSFGEALADELRERGVEVLVVCAGATRTPGFLAASPDGRAPGLQTPEAVARETFRALGRRTVLIPGWFNRIASFVLRRLLPRRVAVRLIGQESRRLLPNPGRG